MNLRLLSIFILLLMCCWACDHKPGTSDTNTPLLSRLTNPSKPWVRSRAIDEMKQLSVEDQRQLVTGLIGKLSDENNYVRQNTAEALGEMDGVADEAVPFLKKAASDPNRDVAHGATVSLARMGHDSPRILGILIDRLRDQSEGVGAKLNRYYAANSIGFIASGSRRPNISAAVPALILALHDSDQSVRERAAWALGSAGPQAEKAVEALKESAWNDSNRNVRHLASWALKKIGTPAAKKALEGWVLTNDG